jgi:catechol 2,3-dioxygenase-like lactoylglutathione lyase family enzyme
VAPKPVNTAMGSLSGPGSTRPRTSSPRSNRHRCSRSCRREARRRHGRRRRSSGIRCRRGARSAATRHALVSVQLAEPRGRHRPTRRRRRAGRLRGVIVHVDATAAAGHPGRPRPWAPTSARWRPHLGRSRPVQPRCSCVAGCASRPSWWAARRAERRAGLEAVAAIVGSARPPVLTTDDTLSAEADRPSSPTPDQQAPLRWRASSATEPQHPDRSLPMSSASASAAWRRADPARPRPAWRGGAFRFFVLSEGTRTESGAGAMGSTPTTPAAEHRLEHHRRRCADVPRRVPGNRRALQRVTNHMIPATRINHAVLYVRDAKASADFYQAAFDFEVVEEIGGTAVFLRARNGENHHDLGLFSVGPEAAPLAPRRVGPPPRVGGAHDRGSRRRAQLAELGAPRSERPWCEQVAYARSRWQQFGRVERAERSLGRLRASRACNRSTSTPRWLDSGAAPSELPRRVN